MYGKRILVLVPHPDDEVVACSAAIGRAKAAGAEVFTLYLTHGCVARDVLWPWQRRTHDAQVMRRRQEAEKVAALLGVTPLGWSQRPARTLWREMGKVFGEIEAVISAHAIDQIWVPAYEGGNADHDALNAIGQALTSRLGVLEFAEYNFADRGTRSQEFPDPNGTEQVLVLLPEERSLKRKALDLYVSEVGNLGYVDHMRECWRPLATYDYAKPPHPGTLWYARFQWVPFRHPRVDFTNPAEVSQAITTFLDARASVLPGSARPLTPAQKSEDRGNAG